ncbi:MAG: class I SAM-dependent methyltransferase [Coriobacteriia bacterium]|nr:class I SAM-dependent methyltransferase [Coriobacteriia bacterium]
MRGPKHLARAVIRRLRRHVMWFGFLGDVVPVEADWGVAKGTPIARYYIDQYFTQNAHVITGAVLEIGCRTYTERYGNHVTQSDILSHEACAEDVPTIVGDLADCPAIPNETYDCVVLTQVLCCLPDVMGALREVYRILKPGGFVLCTMPTISQISPYDMERWGEYWRFTSLGARELFARVFEPKTIDVCAYGNIFAATCSLQGIVAERVPQYKLDIHDPEYELNVCLRAQKLK